MAEKNRRLWLIDAGYMFVAQKSVGTGYQFDYKKLREWLEQGGPLFQAYYVNSTPNPPSDAQDAFHTWLKSAPPRGPKIQVRLYRLQEVHLQCQSCGSPIDNCSKCAAAFERRIQKGVDVGIATLALTLIDRYDTLVLSSGDGDFKDAIEYIRNIRDKNFELLVFKSGVSTDLQSLSDTIHWIDDFKDDVTR